ncbi:MAG: hypothetical protein LAN64_01910 [Acidobacteriia bacterium]|nr:hypothetical protein [Terriglobia bacterium]
MNRQDAFFAYYNTYMRVDIDPAFPVLREIFRRYELSHEQQLWATFLYTAFYHIGSVFLVMQEFPDYEKVDRERLSRWFRHFTPEQRLALFQKDRRWNARTSKYDPAKFQFEVLVESYLQTMQHPRPQAEYLAGATTAREAFKRIRRVKGIGRHAGLAYVETLVRCVGLKLEPDAYINIAEEESHTGYAYLIGKDAVSAKEAAEIVGNLMPVLRTRYPDVPVDAMYMETVGCAFRKLVEGRVYPGFYLDRQAEEINKIAAFPLSCGVHWETLWQIRDEVFPAQYLSRKGIREEWLDHYKRTGQLVNLL